MPTVIALDVSLSMFRYIPGRKEENALTYHQLASKGISKLLEYLALTKLEDVALVTYSSKPELKVDFTRDYDQIVQEVKKAEPIDKICLMSMLKFVTHNLVLNWGNLNYCQVVVFTDCGLGLGKTSMRKFLHNYAGNEQDPENAWLLNLKAAKISFVCLGVCDDSYFPYALNLYKLFLQIIGLRGQLYMSKTAKKELENRLETSENTPTTSPTSELSKKSELGRTVMFEIIEEVCEDNFKPFEATLKCGGYFRTECPILLWPPPTPNRESKLSVINNICGISQKIETCGFISLSDIGSPATLSRHMVLPKVESDKPSSSSLENASGAKKPISEFEKFEQEIRDQVKPKDSKENEHTDKNVEVSNITKTSDQANMCVLLFAALKKLTMAAVVLLGDNWYGFIYPYMDSKNKSNLLLAILSPGKNEIPWLGDIEHFGCVDDLESGEVAAFPVKSEKRSYSQNCATWINPDSLQVDLQKLIRHSKKLPDKTSPFYKELNRLRRSAISIGFLELIEAMAVILETEYNEPSVITNPDALKHFKHAIKELRGPSHLDITVPILPLQKIDLETLPADTAGTSRAAGERSAGDVGTSAGSGVNL